MGKVIVSATICNLEDLFRLDRGEITAEQVRRIEITNALVDTGATTLSAPKHLIDQLGLKAFSQRKALTTNGVRTMSMYGPVRLTIQGRDCNADVAELPDECPVLIGQVPLELLDYVVDLNKHRLVGNPDHGGEHMLELY